MGLPLRQVLIERREFVGDIFHKIQLVLLSLQVDQRFLKENTIGVFKLYASRFIRIPIQYRFEGNHLSRGKVLFLHLRLNTVISSVLLHRLVDGIEQQVALHSGAGLLQVSHCMEDEIAGVNSRASEHALIENNVCHRAAVRKLCYDSRLGQPRKYDRQGGDGRAKDNFTDNDVAHSIQLNRLLRQD